MTEQPRLRPQLDRRAVPAEIADLSFQGIDAGQVLALLTEARQSIGSDPVRANHALDHACHLLGQARLAAISSPLLLEHAAVHQSASTGGLASWQVRKVTAHVEKRIGRHMLTEELAQVAGLSPGHFCRAFKVSMGETPHAFIIRQRIRQAQKLMLDTGHSLSEIASACGLTDQSHLTRLFKRLVGTTPMLWRRTWQKLPVSPA
jgi:AraC family transcriptional regulator